MILRAGCIFAGLASVLALSTPQAAAVDEGQLYWVEVRESDGDAGVYRSALDGSNAQFVLPGSFRSIAIDPARDAMYLTRGGAFGAIWRSDLSGASLEQVIDAPNLTAFAFDPQRATDFDLAVKFASLRNDGGLAGGHGLVFGFFVEHRLPP